MILSLLICSPPHLTKRSKCRSAYILHFIQCFHADNIAERVETYSENNPEGRFRKFSAKEIYESEDCRLDLKWIKDDSVIDFDELGDPLELIEQYKVEVQEYSNKVSEILDQISRSIGD